MAHSKSLNKGATPDQAIPSGTALILVDFINNLQFPGGENLKPSAIKAARCSAKLKWKLKQRSVPVIYANDNFGRWKAEFSRLVDDFSEPDCPGHELVEILRPDADDLSILKPRHSAFYGTPLEFLLDELKVTRLILAGMATEMCILFTAHDAYIRKFEQWVPSDCVASESGKKRDNALRHLDSILGISINPSTSTKVYEAFTRPATR